MIIKIYEIINIFSASMPYYAQIKKFESTGSSEGYSLYLTLFILVASSLRIFFWFGKPFDISLVLQSVLMILTHLRLISKYIQFRQFENNKQSFWNWANFSNYLTTVLGFNVVVGLVSVLVLRDSVYWFEIVGSVSTFIEAVLVFPQIIELHRNKNSDNISLILVLSWLLGDFIKLYYFVVSNSPVQFILSGTMQIILNVVIFLQFLYYKKGEKVKDK